jgi:hypothetical protein
LHQTPQNAFCNPVAISVAIDALEDNDGGKGIKALYLEYFANNQGKKPAVQLEATILPGDHY